MTKEQILERIRRAGGDAGFYWQDLTTGEEIAIRADELFESASVIKLPIYAAVQKLQHEGKVCMDDTLICHDEEKKPSCGALQFFPGDFPVTLDTLCKLMITLSDNTATNMLIRCFGIDGLNAQFREIGLAQSHIERFLFDPEAAARGKENRVTPREMGQLLARIYRREFLSPEISAEMEAVLKKQQIKHKIRGYLPHGIECSHKTGEDAGITNDVGIVFAERPFVICWLFNRADVPEAERAIREITKELAGV